MFFTLEGQSSEELPLSNLVFRIDFLSTDTNKLLSRIKDSERGDFSFAVPELNTTGKKKGKKRNMVNFDNIEEPAFDDFIMSERQMNQFTTNLRDITINEDHFGIHVEDSDFSAWVVTQSLSVGNSYFKSENCGVNFNPSKDKSVLGNSGNIDLDNEEQIRAVMDLFADKTYASNAADLFTTNPTNDSKASSGEQISGDAEMSSVHPPSGIEPPAPDVAPEVAPEVEREVPPVAEVTAQQDQANHARAKPQMPPMAELTSQEIRDLKPKPKKKKRNSGLIIDSVTTDESMTETLQSKDKELYTKENKLGWDTKNDTYFYGL